MSSTKNETEQPKTTSHPSNTFLSWLSPGRMLIGGILLIGLTATVLLVLRGGDICILSNCPDYPGSGDGDLISGFWAFAGGSVVLLALVYFGVPLLPTVGIAAGVWLLMYSTLH